MAKEKRKKKRKKVTQTPLHHAGHEELIPPFHLFPAPLVCWFYVVGREASTRQVHHCIGKYKALEANPIGTLI